MRNKTEKLIICMISLTLISSFLIGSLSMREISTNVDDFSNSVSTSSTQDIFWPGNASEWMEVAPETQGLNSSKIAEMFEFIKDNRQDVHSIIVVRNGYLLVYEYLHHFEIYRDIFGTKTYFGGDNLHGQYSTTKSVISILIGIALQESLLDNINQTLYEFFAHRWSPSFVDSELKKNITIEQLLTMNGGFGGFNIPDAPDKIDADVISFILEEVPLTYTPGTEGAFEYSNEGVDLLSGIIANVSGTSTEEFAKQYLFEPLGISEDEYYWLNDSLGMDYGGSGIECTPKVQAKIGMLALNNGTWNGEQIVDKDFMKDATTNQTREQKWAEYGYLWWMIPPNFTYDGYLAAGAMGQCIYVIPKYNVVVGLTGYDVENYEQIIQDYILQFVEVPETGPNNPRIPGFNLNMILLSIFFVSVIILTKMKKYSNKNKN